MKSFVLTLNNWDDLKAEIKDFICEYCKKKVCLTRKTIISLRRRYSYLQKFSNSEDFIDQINAIKTQITELENKSARGVLIRSKCDFLNDSEKPSKYFVMKERQNSKKKTIDKIEVGDQIFNDNKSIINAFRQFYKELFTEEEIDLSQVDEFF